MGVARAACWEVAPAIIRTGWSPPLPSVADHGMAQGEPSVLHVSVDAVVVSGPSERAERTLSVSDPSPSISTKFKDSSRWDTLGDMGEHSCGVWNVLRVGPRNGV